ncbi:glycosyltransferase family 2 protein [Arachidicoccus soli]|uniref:Glycosyltransferase n=1 Tax=Arachidicoccus soli TaxID=2341117 RepID=A0A386HQP6_9BACT|nr:glycosyltransferase family 2 protein [Arachidicoccus soli]AYD47979.1 glycosyltransferase [Arachidicoccus soli]
MNTLPKISIVTVTYNSAATLKDTIESVRNQDYKNIEYIIVDGASKDNTVDIIKNYTEIYPIKWISEPDKGLYDAMNKGIKMATGDVVGIINSDDFYHNSDTLSKIADAFMQNDIDCVYSDVRFVNPENLEKTIRYYSSKNFKPSKFKWGFMPAHPSFFARKPLFEKFGYYKTDYKIAADFELLLRFLLKNNSRTKYIELDTMKMRTGGVSTKSFRNKIILNKEILRACKENNIKTNLFKIYLRYSVKIFQFLNLKDKGG